MDFLNTYTHGDAFPVMARIPDKTVDLVFTSLPDLSQTEYDKTQIDDYQALQKRAMDEFARVVKDDGFVVICQTDRKVNAFVLSNHFWYMKCLQDAGLRLKDYTDEPDYLYTSMKFKNLIWRWRIERGVGWKYNGESYYSYYRIGYYPRENWKIASQTDDNDVGGSYNLITGIITWKIPKSLIGNPKPGDVLTNTWAFGGLEPIKIMGASFVLFGDHAPDDGYGREYIIKY